MAILGVLSRQDLETIVGQLYDASKSERERVLVIVRAILHNQDPLIIGNTLRDAIDRYDRAVNKISRVKPLLLSPAQLSDAIGSMEDSSEEFADGMILLKYYLLNELGLIDRQDFSGQYKLEIAHLISEAAVRHPANYKVDRKNGFLYVEFNGEKKPIPNLRDLLVQTNGVKGPAHALIPQVSALTELLGALKVATDEKTVEEGAYIFPIVNLRLSSELFYVIARHVHDIEKHYRAFFKHYGLNPKESDFLRMLRHAKISFWKRVGYRKRELEMEYARATWNKKGLLLLPHVLEFTKETIFAVTGLGFEKIVAALYRWAHDKIHDKRHVYHHVSLQEYGEQARVHEHVVRFDSIYKKRILLKAHAYLGRKPYQKLAEDSLLIPSRNEIHQLYSILLSGSKQVPEEIRKKIMEHVFRELIRSYPTNLAVPAICSAMGYLNREEMHHAAKIGIERKLSSGHQLFRSAEEGVLYNPIGRISVEQSESLRTYNRFMAAIKSNTFVPKCIRNLM